MKVLLQRVSAASVSIEKSVITTIGHGLLLFVAIETGDSSSHAQWLSRKIVNLRVFADENAAMNRSVIDVQAEILVVSQFTLAASVKKGNRPDFSAAEQPSTAQEKFNYFVQELRRLHEPVKEGIFGADMQVKLINDGPVTIWLTAS